MANTNKIVLSGYYGFDNIGDEAVLYSIIAMLKQEIPNVRITVLSNNPEKTKAIYDVESVNRWDLKTVTKEIKSSDLLISGGGSLLQDVTSSKTIPYYLAIVKIAQLFKKKVVFYSQGIGPVNKGFSRWLIKRIVNKVDGIFVRDPASKALLEEIGVKKSIGVAIDPVLGIKLPTKRLEDQNAVGVYIRPWKDNAQNERLVAELKKTLVELIQHDYKICLIPMHYEEDLQIAKEIAAAVAESIGERKDSIEVIDSMLTIEEVLDYTASFKFIIGMRLHSLIMAAATKVPMIGLSYDPKVEAFMKEMNNSFCFDVNTVDGEKLSAAVAEVEKNLSQYKAELEQVYQTKKERIYLPINKIKELLNIK